ncbi:MAG: type II secretion system protein, partial [Desulfuromonadales bacterium]
MQQSLSWKRSNRNGFTLLEIMIALAIVSIAMVSLLA